MVSNKVEMKSCRSLLLIVVGLFSLSTILAQTKSTADNAIYPFVEVVSCSNCGDLIISLPVPKLQRPIDVFPPKNLGSVSVQILVDELGNIETAKAIAGHPFFRTILEKAAKDSKFRPKVVNDVAEKFTATIVYRIVSEGDDIFTTSSPISLGVLNERAIELPKPIYPHTVLQIDFHGNHYVVVKIDLRTGAVVLAKAVSGIKIFEKYVEVAAMKAKFRPIRFEGSTLFATGIIVYPHRVDRSRTTRKVVAKQLPIFATGIVNGKAIVLPKPRVPKGCRCKGTIDVRIVVDETGRVVEASAEKGHPLLRIACVQAARNAKFAPTFIDGGRIYVIAYLRFVF